MTATLPALVLAHVSALLLAIGQTPAQGPGEAEATIAWQRSVADALAVQKASGLPLLIAVNMDGEVFNERFAGTVYKDPEFVALTRGYVCVVASPDRHTERDYDAFGNRVECPRFPGCTCSEHSSIEPELFDRYFQGTRNAPRHVGVSPDGKILFDRFLDQSMQTAVDAIRKHRGTPKNAGKALPDSVAALLERRDAAARRALEQRYREADRTGRADILAAARKATNDPVDLLRMPLHDDDVSTFTLGAGALAATATKDGLIDVEDALARTEDPAVTTALLDCLQRLAKTDAAAARLASHFVSDGPGAVLARPWANEWRPAVFDPNDRTSIEAELDRCEAALRIDADASETRLQLAIAQAAFAELLIRDGGRGIELWFADCVRTARLVRDEALQPEVQGLLAHAFYMQGDNTTALGAARLADAAPDSTRQPDAWLAARLLGTRLALTANEVFARKDSAKVSLRAELDRVVPILDALGARGGAPEGPWLAGISVLEFAGRRRDARHALAQVIAAFPRSEKAHERWRARLSIDLGAEGMRRCYAQLVQTAADAPTAQWFAGYAAIVAAERHMRDERHDVARLAYTEAIDRFSSSGAGNADYLDSANHFVVLALAGRAPLRMAAGDHEGAVADLLQAAALRPGSLDDSDGLQRKPRAIAGRIERDLRQQGRIELADRLKPLLP